MDMKRGEVYRRDRVPQSLIDNGSIVHIHDDMYYRPYVSNFGNVPLNNWDMINAYLGGESFHIEHPRIECHNLHNMVIVWNDSIKADVKLDKKAFMFRIV